MASDACPIHQKSSGERTEFDREVMSSSNILMPILIDQKCLRLVVESLLRELPCLFLAVYATGCAVS